MHCKAFCLFTCSSSANVGEANNEPADAVVTINNVMFGVNPGKMRTGNDDGGQYQQLPQHDLPDL